MLIPSRERHFSPFEYVHLGKPGLTIKKVIVYHVVSRVFLVIGWVLKRAQ